MSYLPQPALYSHTQYGGRSFREVHSHTNVRAFAYVIALPYPLQCGIAVFQNKLCIVAIKCKGSCKECVPVSHGLEIYRPAHPCAQGGGEQQ